MKKIFSLFSDLALEVISPLVCHRCGLPIQHRKNISDHCVVCSLDWQAFHTDGASRVLFAERFNSQWCAVGFRLKSSGTRELVHRCKYSGKPHLLRELGGWIASRWPPPASSIVLVPIPIHWRRGLKRGYNQAELLAEGLASKWEVEIENKALLRSSHKSSITDASRKDRDVELRSAFELGESENKKPIILVDDVLTTGATLRICRSILEENGRTVLGAVVLALA
jgi:ComF family protein